MRQIFRGVVSESYATMPDKVFTLPHLGASLRAAGYECRYSYQQLWTRAIQAKMPSVRHQKGRWRRYRESDIHQIAAELGLKRADKIAA